MNKIYSILIACGLIAMPTEYSQAMNQYTENPDAMELEKPQSQKDIKPQPQKHLPLLVAFKADEKGNIEQVTDLRVLTQEDFKRLVRLYGQKEYKADGKTAAQLIVDGVYDTTYGLGIGIYVGGTWFLPQAVYGSKKLLNFLTLGFFNYVQPLIVNAACSTKNAAVYIWTELAAPLCKQFLQGFTEYFASKKQDNNKYKQLTIEESFKNYKRNNNKKTTPQPTPKKYRQPTILEMMNKKKSHA